MLVITISKSQKKETKLRIQDYHLSYSEKLWEEAWNYDADGKLWICSPQLSNKQD